MVIVEVNTTLPEQLMGMHDIFEIGLPPEAKIIPITKPDDRIGTPYIPCDPDKIVAIVMTDRKIPLRSSSPPLLVTDKIGENVIKFLKGEIEAGRLPANPAPSSPASAPLATLSWAAWQRAASRV